MFFNNKTIMMPPPEDVVQIMQYTAYLSHLWLNRLVNQNFLFLDYILAPVAQRHATFNTGVQKKQSSIIKF